jgi:hypothetical protein
MPRGRPPRSATHPPDWWKGSGIEIPYESYAISITHHEAPLPGHLAPLDRRHKWRHQSTTQRGDYWYRCLSCHKRRLVRSISNLITKRMLDAGNNLHEKLSETLWTSHH